MMRCITVDDEPLALKKLQNYIEKTPVLEFCGAFNNPANALDMISNEKIALIYIDINMPDVNGVDFVKSLVDPPMIIFTTAHGEFAVDGFRLDAVDYLLKPFGYEEFLRSVNKAQKYYEFVNSKRQKLVASNGEYIFVKSDYKVIKIKTDDIRYIESMSEYVRIYVEKETKPLITLLSLRKIEESLPKDRFMRVHRSYLVNLSKVEEISRMRIILSKSVYIPIGDNYKEQFFSYIDSNFLGKE